ncbi:MAG: RNA-binding S4 domain-containing protein [Synergistaceae bacterium]|jgi:ribosomal 50S subunit-recycling heat shock protein|nr:RNA-binding S4 domain-containing protein [Synergistaceae bacterium]
MRIDRFLKLASLVKRRAMAQEMVEVGAVRLNGKTVKPSADVEAGDAIELAFPRRLIAVEVLTSDERALKRKTAAFRINADRRLGEDEKPW